VKELYTAIQNLKMEVQTIKKSQREITLKMEKPRKEIRSHRYKHQKRIQEIEMRISGAEDTIENIDTIIKENAKCKKILTQNIQEIQT
jgi:chromosome segregation ATPase